MLIETKFNIGDKVFAIAEKRYNNVENCELCNTSGKVRIMYRESLIICPDCDGKGTFTKGYNIKHEVLTDPIEIEGLEIYIYPPILKKESIFRYTSSEPFIFFTENKLFLTKEEAEEACKKLNDEQNS